MPKPPERKNGRPTLLTEDFVWQCIVETGTGWSYQRIADLVEYKTGRKINRQSVYSAVKRHNLQERWSRYEAVADEATPVVRKLMDVAAAKIKMNDVTESAVVIQALNQSIVALANRVMDRADHLGITGPEDITLVMSSITNGIEVSLKAQKDIAEIQVSVGERKRENEKPQAKTSGDVLNLKERVSRLKDA